MVRTDISPSPPRHNPRLRRRPPTIVPTLTLLPLWLNQVSASKVFFILFSVHSVGVDFMSTQRHCLNSVGITV